MRFPLALAFIASIAVAGPTVPGLDYYLPIKTADYDPAIPTPQAELGYQIGEWHVRAAERVSYLRMLDSLSDRITMETYAHTHGRLPLVMLTITSPENHKKIDAIRKAHLDHVIKGEPEPADAPIIVWMGYSVHGNEPSGTNAAMLLAYHLAAARDAWTKDLLQHAVVLLEPCLNPDGGERFAAWTNDHRGQVPGAHKADTEHGEGWPSGRPNYYWFDLNRDYLPAVMPESQGRLKLWHEWEPNIVTDYHEMGSTSASYFFQPGIAKMVNPLTPPQNQVLTRTLAKEHAKALDAIGSAYYTGEAYDDFYIGKGSTYPDVNGGVGILFEQSSSRGFHQDTDRGRLTFPFTIRNQLTTSFSTLRVALSQRADFQSYQTSFYRDALAEAAKSKTQAYVFSAPGDRARMDAFCTLLERHQIQYAQLGSDVKANGCVFSTKDSILVKVQQRQYRLLTAMFEHRTEFLSAIFYDVSGWHIPSAFGLLSAELDKVPEQIIEGFERKSTSGNVIGTDKPYAYAFAWEPRFAPRSLFKLLQARVRCWTTMRPMDTPSGLHFNPGSIIVPVGSQDAINAEDLRALMQALAKEDQHEIHALTTGMNSSVPDIGSPSIKPVTNTGVLMVVGNGVTSTSAGDVWFEFDQVWQAPLAKVEADQITHATLKSFSTVILTGTPLSALKESGRAALESWVQHGGTLIAIGSSVSSVANEKWASALMARAGSEGGTKSGASEAKPAPRYDEADERRAEREVKGAVVRATFDATHPLCFGYSLHQPHIELLRTSTSSLKPASNAYLNPLRYTDDPVVSGYMSKTNQNVIKGTTPVQLRESGEGRVVFFTDNPVFRGHWLGSEKLLADAIFFSPLVRTGGGDDEKEE